MAPPDAAVVPIQPRPPALEEELGVSIDVPFGSWSSELPNPAENEIGDLLPRLDAMMRNDGHMRALYRLITLPLRRASFAIQPADGGEAEAELIEAMFTRPPHEGGMTTSFDYVRACMGKSVLNGFAAFEEVYTLNEVPDYGLAIVLKKLMPLPAETIRFRADDHGGFDGLVQRAHKRDQGLGPVEIPKHKAFFFNVDKEDHPFYGRPMFLPALYHHDRKHKLYWIAHVAAQFAAIPPRLGYLNNAQLRPSERDAFRRGLADLGFNSAMLVPNGVEVKEFPGGTADKHILELIHHHNVMASQSVLGQFIDLAQGSSATGSFALSKDSSDLFLMSIETLLASMAEHLTWYVVPKFIDWNFGTGRYPKVLFEPLADDMREAMVSIFTSLASATVQNTSSDFLFELEQKVAERLGLSIDYEELARERDEAEQEALDAGKAVLEAVRAIEAQAQASNALDTPGGQPRRNPARLGASAREALVDLAESKRRLIAGMAEVGEIGPGTKRTDLAEDVQRRLAKLALPTTDATGVYGEATQAAVERFQAEHGLPVTGRVDLGSYALLLEES